LLKRHKGCAFNIFEPWLTDVTNDLEFTKRIALRIGKRVQQISLTSPIIFGRQRVLDGDIS
jgi:hypothetical protein